MTVRQQVTELLTAMPGSRVLIDIHEGREVPPLADYYLRPIATGLG
jgi:hypothetical protein